MSNDASFPQIPPLDLGVRQAVESAQRAQAAALRATGTLAGAQGLAQIRQLAVQLERQTEIAFSGASPLQPLIDDLKRDEERRNAAFKALSPLQPLLDNLKRAEDSRRALIEQMIRPAQISAAAIERIRKQVLAPLQSLRDFDAKQERLCAILAERGWVISPSLPIAATHDLLTIHDSEGIDALESHLIKHYDTAELTGLLDGCYNRDSFDRRRHLFDQALKAHHRSEYGLSVPVWLSQIDGIVFEELRIDKVFSKSKRRLHRLRTALGGERTFDDHLLNGLLAVLESAGESARQAVDESVRRNLILHGLDVDYGTQRNSIQGVLVLELLHMFFDSRVSLGEEAA